MALVTHQAQGSYAPSRPFWKRGIKMRQNLAARCTVQRIDMNLLKHTSYLCVEAPLLHWSKRKSLRISSFEGSVQSDKYRDRVRGSQSRKRSFKLSYITQDNENTSSGLPKVQNIHAHSTSNADVTTTGFLDMLKSWLTLMPVALRNEDETLEGLSSNERVETDHKLIKGGILKTVSSSFVGMDATIKIPAIIFIPLFLTVIMKYGAAVANDLTPLWMGGPVIVALYIKMLQMICSLYVFSFKKSVKVVKNFSRGKVKEFIQVHLWQHVVYVRNLDYKDESERIWKEFEAWVGDKCLDYVESMWSYRRTIELLKMAKMM